MMDRVDVDSLSAQYDECERAYLAVVRAGGDRPALIEAAAAVAEAAHRWESAAWRTFFEERDRLGQSARDVVQREIEAEQAEVVAGLWDDITAAHRGD